MDIRECYVELGGDYDAVLARLRSEKLIEKFVLKFPNDGSFELLCTCVTEKNYDEAFRAAHTLKGICQNLGFDRLFRSSSALTEKLRNGDISDILTLYDAVCTDYRITVSAISKLAE